MLYVYDNSCLPEMGVCKITIIYKGIKFLCSFFVGPGIGPALLGMKKCVGLQLLSINCNTMDDEQKGDKYILKRQDKPKINKNVRNNLNHNNKIKKRIDYFIANPDMETNRATSTETIQTIHNEQSDVFTGIGYFKGTFFAGQG